MSFEATVLNSTAIFFSWRPPLLENQNGIIRQYMIVLDTGRIETTIRTLVSGTSFTTTVTNLHPYTSYLCTIAAETIELGQEGEALEVITNETGKIQLHCIIVTELAIHFIHIHYSPYLSTTKSANYYFELYINCLHVERAKK